MNTPLFITESNGVRYARVPASITVPRVNGLLKKALFIWWSENIIETPSNHPPSELLTITDLYATWKRGLLPTALDHMLRPRAYSRFFHDWCLHQWTGAPILRLICKKNRKKTPARYVNIQLRKPTTRPINTVLEGPS